MLSRYLPVLIAEIVGLFLLLGVVTWFVSSGPQGTRVRLPEATFRALPPQVHWLLDHYSIPSSIKNGIVSVEVTPETWGLILQISERNSTHDSSDTWAAAA